ncbi:MAG: 30S ribosomal protein S6, partial [Desulfobacteraceae bacterium]
KRSRLSGLFGEPKQIPYQEKGRKEKEDMRYYETLYLINPDLAVDDYRKVVDKFNSLIEKNNGAIIKLDEWGKKTLAYDVKKFDKGYYVLLNYCGEPDLLVELRRNFKLDDRVLKYQTIKLSNNADPEALKAKTGEGEEEAHEETKPAAEVSPEENGEFVKNQEGENGVQ